jgi:hypothetical protein
MMPIRSLTSTAGPIRRIATLAALSLATVACGSGAMEARASAGQSNGRTAASRPRFSADNYPLDEATVRKVAAVMRAWTPPELPPRRVDPENVMKGMQEALESTFTVVVSKDLMEKDSTATIDRTAPLTAAIASQGLSSRKFAEALMAVQAASVAIDLGDFLAANGGGKPAWEPSDIAKANIALIRKARADGALPTGWW